MIHELKLNNDPFEKIKSGTETIEMRLYDEKRKLIKPNDIIEFTNRKTSQKLKVRVLELHLFSSFEELYSNFNGVNLGYDKDEIKNFRDMEMYYSKEEECKYGVVGIEIKLI